MQTFYPWMAVAGYSAAIVTVLGSIHTRLCLRRTATRRLPTWVSAYRTGKAAVHERVGA